MPLEVFTRRGSELVPRLGSGGRIPFEPPVIDSTVWPFDADEPWRLQSGETLLDSIPAGVPIVNAADYSTSTDLYTVLTAVNQAVSQSVYVQLQPKTYFINQLRSYGTNDWRGWTNGSRRIMGILGAAFAAGEFTTAVQMSPTAVNDSPAGARAYVLDPPQPWTPVPLSAMYWSNTGTSVPLFISGIDFRGTLQGPYGTYSSAAQTKFNRNQAIASPLPYRGLQIWRTVAGARVQHCRFNGFGFTLNNAPPFETGAIDSNYGREIYHRCEFDGRIAADIDAARPLAGGGLMWNKGISTWLQDSRLRHTRRSGWATNTNTNDQAERYYGRRVRISDIASPDDGWAGDSARFPGSNIEAVVGIFDYEDVWISLHSSQPHMYLATPAVGTTSGEPLVLPTDRAIIKVHGGFRTDDTLYGGCLRIGVNKTPNSTGTSPAWQRITDQGINGSGLFEIANRAGQPMTGVKSTAYNPAVHQPETHFVVIY